MELTLSIRFAEVERVCLRDCSLTVPNHHVLVPFHPKITFLRTRFPWARTAFSTDGCVNLFLSLVCIHPAMLHLCSHAGRLVMAEHNFLANHDKLSSKALPLESLMSSIHVFTQFYWDLCILCSVTDFTTFRSRPILVPSVVSTVQKSFMTWISSSFATLSCSMWQNVLSMRKQALCTGAWKVFHHNMNRTWTSLRIDSCRPSMSSLYSLSRPRHKLHRITGVSPCIPSPDWHGKLARRSDSTDAGSSRSLWRHTSISVSTIRFL
jgi:hypothetical protein